MYASPCERLSLLISLLCVCVPCPALSQESLSWFQTVLWAEQAGAAVEPCQVLSDLSFSDFCLFQKANLDLRVLNMVSVHISFCGKNFVFNFYVCSNANNILGASVDSSGFAIETFMGCSF